MPGKGIVHYGTVVSDKRYLSKRYLTSTYAARGLREIGNWNMMIDFFGMIYTARAGQVQQVGRIDTLSMLIREIPWIP